MLKTVLHWLKARALERSTYAGLATIAASFVPGAGPIINALGLVVGAGLTTATTTAPTG